MIPTLMTTKNNRSRCKICEKNIKTGDRAIEFGSTAFRSKMSTAKVHLSCWVEKQVDIEDLVQMAAKAENTKCN